MDTNKTVLTPRHADINAIMMDLRNALIDVTIHETSANLLCNYIETLERSRIQPAASEADTCCRGLAPAHECRVECGGTKVTTAASEADHDEMERRGWVNVGYKHDVEKARRALSHCDIPGFDQGMSLDNAIYELRRQRDEASEAGAVPVRIERKVYRETPEHYEYLSARFPAGGHAGNSFPWQGHRWMYQHTSFDDCGDYDLIWRPAPPSAPAAQPEKQAALIPDGWKLVPSDPTPGMIQAGVKYCQRADAYRYFRGAEVEGFEADAVLYFKGMLSAAPPAPSQQAAPAAEPVAIVNEVGGVDWMPGRCSSMRVGDVLYDGPVPAAESAEPIFYARPVGKHWEVMNHRFPETLIKQGFFPVYTRPTAATADAQGEADYPPEIWQEDAQGDDLDTLFDPGSGNKALRRAVAMGLIEKHEQSNVAQGDERALKRWDQSSDEVRRAMFLQALSRQPSAAASAEDEFYWILVSEPGKVVVRKGGWTDSKFVEQMLRELYAAKPDATCIVVKGPYHLYGTDGREWVSMYGDQRRKPIPSAALAAAKPTCPHEREPRGCYRIRCQLGNACADAAAKPEGGSRE